MIKNIIETEIYLDLEKISRKYYMLSCWDIINKKRIRIERDLIKEGNMNNKILRLKRVIKGQKELITRNITLTEEKKKLINLNFDERIKKEEKTLKNFLLNGGKND